VVCSTSTRVSPSLRVMAGRKLVDSSAWTTATSRCGNTGRVGVTGAKAQAVLDGRPELRDRGHHPPSPSLSNGPKLAWLSDGRGWDRTSDLPRVKSTASRTGGKRGGRNTCKHGLALPGGLSRFPAVSRAYLPKTCQRWQLAVMGSARNLARKLYLRRLGGTDCAYLQATQRGRLNAP
jgi:hypothetical protein